MDNNLLQDPKNFSLISVDSDRIADYRELYNHQDGIFLVRIDVSPCELAYEEIYDKKHQFCILESDETIKKYTVRVTVKEDLL